MTQPASREPHIDYEIEQAMREEPASREPRSGEDALRYPTKDCPHTGLRLTVCDDCNYVMDWASPGPDLREHKRQSREGTHLYDESCALCTASHGPDLIRETLEVAIEFGHGFAYPKLGHTEREWRDCPQTLCGRVRAALSATPRTEASDGD